MLCPQAQVKNLVHVSHILSQSLMKEQLFFVKIRLKLSLFYSTSSSSKRPERLISKLKTMNLEDAARGGKKIVVIRQPRGPEGIGFKATRNV